MQRHIWAILVVAACGAGLWAWAQSGGEPTAPSRPEGLRHEGLTFSEAGGRALKLDLVVPEGAGPFPVVVCIHGGGWTGGDRKQMAATIATLARRGFVGVSIDYRTAPADRFPACLDDCKAAVRWLRGNAGRYKVDANKVGAMGLSAGGHLACLLAMTGGVEAEATGDHASQSSRIQAVCGLSTPTDLTSPLMHGEEVLRLNLVPLLGGRPEEKADEYRKASPCHYDGRNAPPMLLIHGTADKAVPVSQARELANKVRSAGGKAEVLELEGAGHTWTGAQLVRGVDKMLSFFDEALKK